MTVNVATPWLVYQTDGVQTSYPYDFYLKQASDLAVYWANQRLPPGSYTVTGVGQPIGGMVVFPQPLPPGEVVLRRQTPQNQLTDYVEGDAFPADSHEMGLDRLTLLVQDLMEQFSRTPLLAETTGTAHRWLPLPDPQPNTLLGWDSAAQQWTLYPSGVTQIQVDPVSGIGWGKNTLALACPAGEAQLTGLLFPAGVLAIAVSAWVETSIGTSQGVQQVGVGTVEQPDCWGLLPALTSETTTTAGLFQSYGGHPHPQSGVVALTAYGGLFDGAGVVYVTGHFMTFGPAQQVGYSYTPGSPDESQPLPPVNVPLATETVPGILPLATTPETRGGTNDTDAVTPLKLAQEFTVRLPPGAPLSVTRYQSAGPGVESTPGLSTTSDGRLGVGMAPESTYALSVLGSQILREGASNMLSSGGPVNQIMTRYGGSPSTQNQVRGRTATGTEAAPTATDADTLLLALNGAVHDGSGAAFDPTARLSVELRTAEAITPTAKGTTVKISTTLVGTTNTAERLAIDGRGNLTTWGAVAGAGLQAGLVLKSGARPTAAHPPAAIQAWVENQEGAANQGALCLRSEDGTITTIGSGLLHRYVGRNVAAPSSVSAPYVLTPEMSGKLLMGNNAVETAGIQLPSAPVLGQHFVVVNNQPSPRGTRVLAPAGQQIRLGATLSASGGSLQTTTVGDTVELIALSATLWQTRGASAGWTVT